MDGEKWLAGILAAVVVVVAMVVVVVTQGQRAWAPILAMSILIAAGAIVLALIAAGHRRRERREAIATEASALGFSHEAKLKNAYHTLARKHTHLSNRGAKITSHLSGTVHPGAHAAVFEHAYLIMAGQTPIHVQHRVAVLEAPADWPVVEIKLRKIRWLRRLWPMRQIDFEEEAFNDRYSVESPDEGFAIALLTPELQQWLAGLETPLGHWHIEGGRIFYLEEGRLRPGDPRRMLEREAEFLSLTPPELRYGFDLPTIAVDRVREMTLEAAP